MGYPDDRFSMLRRYAGALHSAWQARGEYDVPSRTRDELAFLPAHLELIDSPAPPAPRVAMWLIIALFTLALIWSFFGELEMVAVAEGKTVADSRTKVIQSVETAVVRRILVRDGQHVARGDLLLELDRTAALADASKADDAWRDATLTVLRSTALVKAAAEGQPPLLIADASLPRDLLERAQALAQGQYVAYRSRLQSLQAVVVQKRAELATVEASLPPLRSFLEVARTRLADYEKLLDKKYVPRQEYLLRKQEVLSAERDLVEQSSRRAELRSAIHTASEDMVSADTESRRQWLDDGRQAGELAAQAAPEARKARQHDESLQLRAPVAGTVQQLEAHTQGGVVTAAQPLLSIVPDDDPLSVEITVLNKDIGFLRAGQRARVKIESFPYTRYGYIDGTLESISHDAIQDEKLGWVYRGQVRLDRSTLVVDGAEVHLGAGMTLSTEIKTGRRRVIDYLIDPLQSALQESLRER
jgi:hemolysin D